MKSLLTGITAALVSLATLLPAHAITVVAPTVLAFPLTTVGETTTLNLNVSFSATPDAVDARLDASILGPFFTVASPSVHVGSALSYDFQVSFHPPLFPGFFSAPLLVTVTALDSAGFALDIGGQEIRLTGIAEALEAPLPTALPLFAAGIAGLGWLARRRKRQAA